jgi:hypothetical protein
MRRRDRLVEKPGWLKSQERKCEKRNRTLLRCGNITFRDEIYYCRIKVFPMNKALLPLEKVSENSEYQHTGGL